MMMSGVQATAAGGTTLNVLTGQLYERSPVSGRVRFAITGDAAGEGRITIYIGGRVILTESAISRQARPPLIPDDVLTTELIGRGEQIVVQHRNTGAGSNNLFWRLDFAGR